MTAKKSQNICITPKVHGVGGMVSFRHKFTAKAESSGVGVTTDLSDRAYDAVLVIGGTRQLGGLLRAKRAGVRIIQRLNGMNWMHRKMKTGIKHYLRSEYGNMLLNLIRTRFVDGIIYQSEFSQQWWERVHGPTNATTTVIYNGVDLEAFTPNGTSDRPQDRHRLLLVEGSLQGGYETGLETAVALARSLEKRHHIPLEMIVAGKVSPEIKAAWDHKSSVPIEWAGLVANEDIPALDRSAHMLFAADINAACPNSVIEALGCGLPVVAFDTGALAELVDPNAGRIVPYGGDPWALDPPDIDGLAAGAAEIIRGGDSFREAARKRAEKLFGLDHMTARYLEVLLG